MAQDARIANPVELVERQLAAYNKQDLEAFLEVFSDEVEVICLPGSDAALSGKAAFAQFYAEKRFNRPGLRAEVVNRMVLGNKVIDHERIHGIADAPVEMVVVYAIEDGLIRRVWSLVPE